MDSDIYLQEKETIESTRSINKLRYAPHNMINLRDCLFVLCPKLNFDFHKEYKRSLTYYKKLLKTERLTEKQALLKAYAALTARNLEINLQKFGERISREKELNELMIKEREGKDVLYGDEVYLMHFDSKSFIQGKNDCAETNKVGYDCKLSTWYSMSMVFKVLPRYKSRQEGEIIQYRDNLVFYNTKYNTYLSFASDLELPHDKAYEQGNTRPFRQLQHILDPCFNRFRVYLSQQIESAWRVMLFRSYDLGSNLVLGNDLIKLKHTELGGYLSADLTYFLDNPEVHVKNYVGEYQSEENSAKGVWEIEHVVSDERGKEFALNTLVKPDGVTYRKSQVFRLRHFSSGMLLDKVKHNDKEFLVLSSPIETKGKKSNFTKLTCIPILKHIDNIHESTSYFFLTEESPFPGHEQDPLYIKCSRDKDNQLARRAVKQKLNRAVSKLSEFYAPLEDSDLPEERRVSLP